MRTTFTILSAWAVAGAVQAAPMPAPDRFAGYETVVQDTHRAWERVLREVVAKDAFRIQGAMGETLWCLAALYLDERPMWPTSVCWSGPRHPMVKKWWAFMADIMEVHSDNSPICTSLNEVFHMD